MTLPLTWQEYLAFWQEVSPYISALYAEEYNEQHEKILQMEEDSNEKLNCMVYLTLPWTLLHVPVAVLRAYPTGFIERLTAMFADIANCAQNNDLPNEKYINFYIDYSQALSWHTAFLHHIASSGDVLVSFYQSVMIKRWVFETEFNTCCLAAGERPELFEHLFMELIPRGFRDIWQRNVQTYRRLMVYYYIMMKMVSTGHINISATRARQMRNNFINQAAHYGYKFNVESIEAEFNAMVEQNEQS